VELEQPPIIIKRRRTALLKGGNTGDAKSLVVNPVVVPTEIA
jgi:hypothetical protein